jgi:hypothetical protein
MKLSKSVAELQRQHVVLELECIDRMYLNAYVPQLTSEAGVAGFVRGHLGYRFASTKQVAEMTEAFVESIMQFGLDHKIDLVRFKKGQRKDNVMQARLKASKKNYQEGVLFTLGGSCEHFLTGSEKRAVAAQMQARFDTTSAVAGCELGNYEIYFIKTGLFARPASRAIA